MITTELQVYDKGMELPFRATSLSCGAMASSLNYLIQFN